MATEPRLKSVLAPNDQAPERVVFYLDGREVDLKREIVVRHQNGEKKHVSLATALGCLSGHKGLFDFLACGKGSSGAAYYAISKSYKPGHSSDIPLPNDDETEMAVES